MLCYLFFVFIIGVPVICAEFAMGRSGRSGILGAFRKCSGSRRWDIVGYGGIIAGLLILSFYSVVASWTVGYTFESATGQLAEIAQGDVHSAFGNFISGWWPAILTVVFLAINGAVVIGGVQKGIERFSNILTPLLFVILLIFCVNSLTLSGCGDGLRFLFAPDFSQLTPSVILGAMGQAFFSLSIGLGCMMTYASYFSDETPLFRSACSTALLDTLVAVLAGIIIFPAVFTYGFSPTGGPTLVFEVLPDIFSRMAGGRLWSTMFFFLLAVASLTSTISMSEIPIAFLCDEYGMTRRKATIITTSVAMVLGVLCALSFGILPRLNLFNIFDFVSSNILLPLGGMTISLFVGWRLDRATLLRQLNSGGRIPLWVISYLIISLRYIAPACIAAVFIWDLF